MIAYDDTRPWRPILEAGVYDGVPHDAYHADVVPGGSLSASGAKALLPPNPPARFHYARTHPRPQTRAMTLGTAAHTCVLGRGELMVVIDAADYKTTKAREKRDAAIAAGQTPLLAHEFAQVQDMAAALLQHDLAPLLFAHGAAEQSAYWIDAEFGMWRRARFDWLPEPRGGRLIVPDYKTTATGADAVSFGKTIANLGYAMQADWYCSALAALGIDADPVFVFVVQEKDPPYLVNVIQLPQEALRIGRTLNEKALRVYATCDATGVWPGYTDVQTAELPSWFTYQHQEER